MKIDQLLMHSEDEMDFLPIIPLNESDQEDLNGIEVLHTPPRPSNLTGP